MMENDLMNFGGVDNSWSDVMKFFESKQAEE